MAISTSGRNGMVFDSDWDTVERAEGLAFAARQIGGARLLQGMVGIEVGPRLDRFVDLGDPLEAGLDQFFGCALARADGLSRRGGAQLRNIHLLLGGGPPQYLTL